MRISDWSSDVCSSDLLRLFQQGPGRLEDRSRQPSWKQQILRPDRAAACGQTEPGEASEYDVGQRRKTVQDQRERADLENLLEDFSDNIVLNAERRSVQRSVSQACVRT